MPLAASSEALNPGCRRLIVHHHNGDMPCTLYFRQEAGKKDQHAPKQAIHDVGGAGAPGGVVGAGGLRSRPAGMGRRSDERGAGAMAGIGGSRRPAGDARARSAASARAGGVAGLRRSAQVVQPGGEPGRRRGPGGARCTDREDDPGTGRRGPGLGAGLAVRRGPAAFRARGDGRRRRGAATCRGNFGTNFRCDFCGRRDCLDGDPGCTSRGGFDTRPSRKFRCWTRCGARAELRRSGGRCAVLERARR